MGRLTLPTTSYNPKEILSCSNPELRTIFKKHDDNRDGKLSWAEVKAAFKELGSHWPWLVTEDAFRHADLDDNGYIDIETELELLVTHASKFNYKSKNVI
ncbi:hypothetical protein I3843_15G054900 [Carya illinoinensis]|uniref:EF-hand domain-containing protein n=1 Tax=Carya illinoinensis TaxID=32201 RepID=A0A8T1N996_CARIL|nr:hypothetical protein I3760_15G057300 [Carya illinoinensis]KAG6626582.1 hypothetical protein CIPAW_15G059800 [Carya illinoinensis]KAG6674709.1 hypothetical protein I3842_15G058200 [Carya illinoinensis]KAG7943681.1 hypothetical protein I3843_15G054900 [Carya illinoinensis]